MIFFDLDGTLLDHDRAVQAGISKFLETFASHFNETPEKFLAQWEATAEKYLDSYAMGNPNVNFQDQRRKRMREIFGMDLSDGDADSKFEVYKQAYSSSWHLYPDAEPCLQALKGRRLGLITNGDSEQQRAKIATLGIGRYFSTIIISREVNCAKPQREIFELAAKTAQVKIEECIYIGDRLETDAVGSRNAGMKGIWLDRRKSGLEVEGIPKVPNLVNFPSVIS